MDKMDLITKLLSIKRIIAFILTLVFSYLAATGKVQSTEFITIFSMVIAFYFGQSLGSRNTATPVAKENPKEEN